MISKQRTFIHLLVLIATLWQVPTASVRAEPNAPNLPTNVACRPHGGRTDSVRVEWKDTNDEAADYRVYRRLFGTNDWGDPIATVDKPNDDGVWRHVDASADTQVIYQYAVTAKDGDSETAIGSNEFCREPIWLDSNEGNYRMFYRLNDCPEYDDKKVCTENVNVDGKNKHVAQMLETSEDYRTAFMDLGFSDPGNFGDLDKFPLDMFPCNNGCANGDGVQYPPEKFEEDDYVPATGEGYDYEVFIAGHEIFHKVQGAHGGGGADPYYKWLIEGQARVIEDKVCIFSNAGHCTTWDNIPKKFYHGEISSYLGRPYIDLREQSYSGVLFWLYFTEQFGNVKTEPHYGMDAMLKYWQKNKENKDNDISHDGIETLNDLLADTDYFNTERRFKDIFQDFAVANYAKDYIVNPAPLALRKYNYIDDELPGLDFGKVFVNQSATITPGTSLLGEAGVNAWAAQYFEFNLDPTVATVNLQVNPHPGTPHELYYHVLAIDNNEIVDQWDDLGKDFDLTIPTNAPQYDRLVLIVVGMNKHVNFDYGVNLTSGIYIQTPNAQFPDAVGDPNSPGKFVMWLRVLDGGDLPVEGIDPNDFTISVGGKVIHPPPNGVDDALISSFYNAGRYVLTLRAPANPGCTKCPLGVSYGNLSDSEADAILYGPPVSIDNLIVIDRSGSMEGAKFDAARGAAKVYVDSYETGDRIGVISYNDTPKTEYGLTGWDNNTRQQAQNEIETLAPPDGATAIGGALLEGLKQLDEQDSPNPAWAMVLLSDGMDTVEDTDLHIPKFVSTYKKRIDGVGDVLQVPAIHAVAVGDDADGAALQQVSDVSGGTFQFLPETTNLMASGVVAAEAQALDPAVLQLNLSEIYRVFAEEVVDEQQIYAKQDAITNAQSKTHTIHVEGSAGQLIVMVKYVRNGVIYITPKLRRPDNTEVGPPALTGGTNSSGHWFWRIPAPASGDWKLTISPIIPGAVAAGDESASTSPDVPNAEDTDFLVEAALVSNLTLEAFLGLPVEERLIGKPMPIFALLSDNVPVTGATVKATVDRTGEKLTLYDDGKHNDAAANDGVYGGLIKNTFAPGGYNVIVDADGTAPLVGQFVRRERLSFFLSAGPNRDQDLTPDWWEGDCTDPTKYDHDQDPDQDGLINLQEYLNHTNPCDSDTDDGGESDGSEVTRGVDPLFPPDDNTRPPVGKAWPSVNKVTLWTATPNNTAKFDIYRSNFYTGPFTLIASDVVSPTFVDTNVVNGTQYCYRLVGKGRATSAPSDPTCTMPKRDPYPPHGEVALVAPAGKVPPTTMLLMEAFDNPNTEEHPAFDGALLDPAQQSGVVEMLLSNRADFVGATWEPYQALKSWTLLPRADGLATVFVRYKDAAGNISDEAALSIFVDNTLPLPSGQKVFLPLVAR